MPNARLQWICVSVLALSYSAAALAKCRIAQIAELPVTHARNRPLLQGHINGQDVDVLVDTGGAYSFVWEGAAIRLGLPLSGVPRLRVFGVGGEAETHATLVKQLQIGAFTAKDLQLLALGGTQGKQPQDAALVLGYDFFSNFTTEFDIAHGAIRLLRPEGCQSDELAYWATTYSLAEIQPISADDPKIRLDVLVNGKHIPAILDTGAQTSSIETQAAQRAGVASASAATAPAGQMRGIANKPIESWVGTFASVSIGDETIRNVKLRVADLFGRDTVATTGSRLQRSLEGAPEMLLGFDFLLAHRALIVPKEHKLLFTYEGGPLFQFVEPAPASD